MSRSTVLPNTEQVVSSDEEEQEDFESFIQNNEDKLETAAHQKLIYEKNIVSAVRKYPAIWDKGDSQYKNVHGRPLLWQKVAREVGRGTWLDAKNTWHMLIKYYGRYRRTLKHPSGIASAEVKAIRWPHFQSMHGFLAKNLWYYYRMKQQRISNINKILQKPRKSLQYRIGKVEDMEKARKGCATAHDQPTGTIILRSGSCLDDDALISPTNTDWTSPDVNFQPANEGCMDSMGEPSSSLPAIETYNELEQEDISISSNRNKVEVCSGGANRATRNFVSADKFLMAERPIKVEEGIPVATSREPPIQAENKSAGHNSSSRHASRGCTSCQVLGGKLGFAETRTRFLETKLNQVESKVQWTKSQSKQYRNQCEELQNRLLACQEKTINCLESCARENVNEIREKLLEILQSTYV